MNKVIDSFQPNGTISIPSSTNYSGRYLISAFIANKPVVLTNIAPTEEVSLFIKALETLGAIFEVDGTTVKFIKRVKNTKKQIIIYCGSYISIFRVLFPVASSLYQNVIFTGSEEIFNVPLEIYKDICERQEIKLIKSEGRLELKGAMSPIDMKIRGDVSSDFICGLIYMFAISRSNNYIYPINGVVSTLFITTTLNILAKFGYIFEVNESYYRFVEKKDTTETRFDMELDFSLLASFAVLGCLKGGVRIKDVPYQSEQADFEIIKILKDCNANIVYKDNVLEFNKSELSPINCNIEGHVDLLPSLLVLAACIDGQSKITGINNLSTRSKTLINGMLNQITKTGVKVGWQDDEIDISGDNKEGGYEYDSYSNFRILIALTILSIIKKGRSFITNAECLDLTYPNFFETLESLKS